MIPIFRITSLLSVLFLLSGCGIFAKGLGLKDCAPVYGNWCGENYPLTGNRPRPVDDWDRACRQHDLCYDSGEDKRVCDEEFVEELEYVSRYQLAPQEMHNAYHLFKRNDGYVEGWFDLGNEMWAMMASCEGGDGVAATFHCALQYGGGCWLDPEVGPGRAGMMCNCGGYPGVIVER